MTGFWCEKCPAIVSAFPRPSGVPGDGWPQKTLPVLKCPPTAHLSLCSWPQTAECMEEHLENVLPSQQNAWHSETRLIILFYSVQPALFSNTFEALLKWTWWQMGSLAAGLWINTQHQYHLGFCLSLQMGSNTKTNKQTNKNGIYQTRKFGGETLGR